MEMQFINSRTIIRFTTIVLLVAILITLFLPWVRIGSKNSDLRYLLQNSYYSVSELVDVFFDTFDIGNGDFSDRFFAFLAKRLTHNFEDCKLSLAELTESLLEISCILVTAAEWNSFKDFFSNGGLRLALLLLASLILFWSFLVLLLGALRSLLDTIKGRRAKSINLFTPYAVAVVLMLLFTIAANYVLKDIMKELIGVSLRAALHVKMTPFIGLILAGILRFALRYIHADALDSAMFRWRAPNLDREKEYFRKICHGAGKKAGWRCECNAFNMFNAVYCQKCGTRRPDKLFCSSCGTTLKDGSRFCHVCGARVVYEKKRTCRRCGAILPLHAGYCGKCGCKVELAGEAASNNEYQAAMGE